ncbi:MAG TPA: DoxX family protein [Acidimicrobiales bacterium]|nr:DoxX family protein [Acidimicrobiales bacterium]
MGIGRLALRATVGGLMLGHGLQKLNGSFDGPGLEGTAQVMGAIGMHPAQHQAKAAAISETAGGALTLAGLFSPLGPAMIMGTMAVAISKVHARNGVWVQKQGYEYNATLIAAAAALAELGPGPLSLDGLLRRQRSGTPWALLAAGLGAGAAYAAMAVSDKMAPAAQGSEPTAAAPEATGTVATPPPAGSSGSAGSGSAASGSAGSGSAVGGSTGSGSAGSGKGAASAASGAPVAPDLPSVASTPTDTPTKG